MDINEMNMRFYLMYIGWEQSGVLSNPDDYDLCWLLNNTEVFDDYCYMPL